MSVASLVVGILGCLVAFAPSAFGLLAIVVGVVGIVLAVFARRRGQRIGTALAFSIVAVVLGALVPFAKLVLLAAMAWR